MRDVSGRRCEIQKIRDSKYAQAQNENLGMSWFLYTIYFKLFAGILWYVFDFVSACTNDEYDKEILVILGAVYIVYSVINIYVRHLLSCFYHNSLKIYFIAMYAVPIIFGVIAALITEDTSLLPNVAALLIYVIPELIYYHKRSHLFDVTVKKGKNLRMIKTLIIGVMYLLAVFIQFAAFTPYTTQKVYISSQNVPHVFNIDNGYTSFVDVNNTYTDEYGVTTSTQINYVLFAFQLTLTTAVAISAYFFFCHKKYVPVADADEATDNDNISKKQTEQMQQIIDNLSLQLNQTKLENKALQEQIMQLYNSFGKATANVEEKAVTEEPPYIDINGLAFADDEEIRNAQKQYAEDLYKYFKAKDVSTTAQKNTSHTNEQISIFDAPPEK